LIETRRSRNQIANMASSKKKISYFYDPEVGNFYYGQVLTSHDFILTESQLPQSYTITWNVFLLIS
jgi:hypothetical protein